MKARRATQAKKIKPWAKVKLKLDLIHRGIYDSQEDQALVVKVKVKGKTKWKIKSKRKEKLKERIKTRLKVKIKKPCILETKVKHLLFSFSETNLNISKPGSKMSYLIQYSVQKAFKHFYPVKKLVWMVWQMTKVES